jgi:hypothetical protein
MSQLSQQSVGLYFVFMGFVWLSLYTGLVRIGNFSLGTVQLPGWSTQLIRLHALATLLLRQRMV